MLENVEEVANDVSDLSFDDDVAVESNGIHAFMDAPFKGSNSGDNKESEAPKKRPEMAINGNMDIEDDFDIPEETIEKEDSKDLYYNNVFNNFKELGLISEDVIIEDGKILDNEALVNILDEEKRKGARKIFEEEFLSRFNDEDSLDYIEYILSGGTSSNYFDKRSNAQIINIDGDISDERVQDKIIKTYLSKFDNASSDEIKDHLEMLNMSNKKEKFAKKYLGKIKEYEKQEKQRILQEQEEAEKKKQAMIQDTYNLINNTLSNTEDIFGIRCDDAKRNRIMEMFYKPIQLKGGGVTTEYQYRLNMAQRDPKMLIILADLLANNLDINRYNKSMETTITRKIKAGLDAKPRKQKNSPFDSLFK